MSEVAPKDLAHLVKLVAGKMPDQSAPGQVLASFTLEQDGVHIGTTVRLPLWSPSQASAIFSGANIKPTGPVVSLRVVAIEAAESEFPATYAPQYDLYTTQAFARTVNPKTVGIVEYFVRLRHGAADLPAFQTEAERFGFIFYTDLDAEASAVSSSIHPQVVGWWALTGLAGLVGMIVVAQALARQDSIDAATYATLSALGVSRRQLVGLGLTTTVFVGTAGVVGGIGLAFLLSPLTPVGEARLADPSTGFDFEPLVLLAGAVAMVVVVVALGLLPAIVSARALQAGRMTKVARPPQVVALLAQAGAPPSALIGVHHGLERGRGREAVPVGPALVGSVLAVTALCATAVFGASLAHLTGTPALYGEPFDLAFITTGPPSAPQLAQLVAVLEHDAAISEVSVATGEDVRIDGTSVDALAGQALRGQLLVTTTGGRLPRADGEVALGPATLRQVGAHVGSVVQVTSPTPNGETRTSSFRVVGTAVLPPDLGTAGLGTGAMFTLDSWSGARCPPGAAQVACLVRAAIGAGGSLMVSAAPGPQGRAALGRLARVYSAEVSFPAPPTNLVNFGDAVNFPLMFGLVLIVFGAATLTHLLIVSVTRRRQEMGLLKALGFVRRQVAFCVLWQTTTVALLGAVVGVPAGTATGRLVWRAFAGNIGVLPVPVVAA